MPASRSFHLFRLTSSYGPERLFGVLRGAVEARPGCSFDFDWLKRRIALRARDVRGLEGARVAFFDAYAADDGPVGALLPGKVVAEADGAVTLPIGVLLQDAAAFAQLIALSLADIRVGGVELREHGEVVAVPITGAARRADYETIVIQFPVPAYIRISDEGQG